MNIDLPPILSAHTNTLREFFEGMVLKLAVNAYKDELLHKDVPILIGRMLDELQELKDEVGPDGHINQNALSEAFDGANFFYLLYQFMRKAGVPDDKERFIEEFFDVQIDTGQIFAVRNRSGSRYRIGDEVLGTYRKGRCYIRTQSASSGSSISLPRDHIVWWKATGQWPTEELVHLDDDLSNDAIENLGVVTTSEAKPFLYVSQWKPRGKENHSSYGKYRFQRRHNLVLVTAPGYYDTPEEAAREGLAAWKKKVKELSSV